MKKTIKCLIIFILIICKVYGQGSDLQNLVDQGVHLHDKGDYKGAIEKYKKALEINSKSDLANYEISSSYFALEQYEKAIKHSNKVISEKSNYVDQAYILKGSALDMMGKTKEAIKTYKKGIKAFPENHLLYYNLAYTDYKIKEIKEAEEALQKALVIMPAHASSHLLLGYITNDMGQRVKSLLALYNFLLLEPTGKRASSAFNMLSFQLKKGVKKKSSNEIVITMSADNAKDEFRTAELMLSLLEASKSIEENENKTEIELFSDNSKSFFSVLGEMKKDNTGFWWNYYVDFFYALKTAEDMETFGYYISQSRENEQITAWIKSNPEKVEKLLKWNAAYVRKF